MADSNEELSKWFEELQKVPPQHHLLCPRVGDDDDEDYKNLHDPESKISVDEKQERIRKGDERIEITYWNSLIFGYDKRDAGKWLVDFTERLEQCLKSCPECVLNWHMKRKFHLQKFAERWNEETVAHVEDLLERLDERRIGENLNWAKDFIEKIEATGAQFKKSQFGERLADVHISIYEALCCVRYLANPDQRTVFQRVFMRLQGKSYLKLGTKNPLPGMTYFMFDQKNEDRRKWAQENWKNIDDNSISEQQFDWAVSGGLIEAIDQINRRDPLQAPEASTDIYLEVERFWQGFEEVLRTMGPDLIMARLRSLELSSGSRSLYDLMFYHIFFRSEGVLVVIIRVLSMFLKKASKAFWDVIGDARPNVVADMLFNSPVYPSLLRQSLENCWTGFEGSSKPVPFPTSWIEPWLDSLSRDRRYDACESLMHTLFEGLAKDPAIGEPGQSACIRAGFDALRLTMNTYGEHETKVGTGNTHLNASAALNLVLKYKDIILKQMHSSEVNNEGWKTFKVGEAAAEVMLAAMRLDIKLFLEEYQAINDNKPLQTAITRNAQGLWEAVIEMFDRSTDQVSLSQEIMRVLGPLIVVEHIRPRKTGQLDEPSKVFNASLSGAEDALSRLFGRISELDTTDLSSLFSDRMSFQVIVGLSLHGETDLAEASSEVLKAWTGELSRSAAMENMAQLHPDQTLASMVFCLERILKPPYPWDPIRPLLNMSRDVLRGLAEPSSGVLRTKTLDSRSVATVLRWWNEQWRFVSRACLNIESWSFYITNAIMTEFCREIMELAEALVAEDGLLTSATALGRSENDMMVKILAPAKENFRGMENLIRLKDRYLVDVTVRVLCRILKRLRENNLEINSASRKLITDACLPTATPGKYLRTTNLTDQQRAELLQALGQTDEEVQIYQLGTRTASSTQLVTKEKSKKQSRLDAWSKSGSSSPLTSSSSSAAKPGRSNREHVLELSKSLDSPVLKQLEARRLKAKAPDQKSISALRDSRQREKAEKAKRDAEAIAYAKQVRGELGSGSSLINGQAQDPRSEIMVNSSDEDSSESDSDSDADGQLAALSTGNRKSIDDAERQRRLALKEKLRRPVKKERRQRSVKEMRARLIPPMERLHRAILAWDIFHEGNDPPNGPKATEVATKYADPKSYQERFFPLLVSEAWRSFVTSKDEITAQPFGMKIASRASVDSFLEIAFSMPIVQNRERGVSEGDILLVSEAEQPLADPSARHCLARVHRIKYKKDLIEITYRVASGNQLATALSPGNSVYGVKITNMTTIEREYAALESLQYYDLMDEILKAEPSPILRYGDEKITNWMQNWELNRGQAMAVLGAQENDGFTLIQGPPGTGKTKTIIAMVGALLSEQLSQSLGPGLPTAVPVRPAGAAAAAQQRGKKLLVCAPSNAAVDELVLRLKNGITTTNGKTRKINVLRLGRTDAINTAVKDVTLDELVRVRLEGDDTKEKAQADRDKLHEEAAKVRDELADLRPRLEEARGAEDRALYNTLSRQFDDLKRRQMSVGKQIDATKASGNSIAREVDMRRRQVQQEILNSAQVLCATLSGSGHEMFRNLDVEFETVIIDEAAQCVELSALIPLKYGCCKCILVGDPKQLPPTVLSQSAARFGYDQSLFVRMQQNHPKSVHLLDMQYRMHPEISVFPSREFYEGQLKDGQDMLQLRQMPWHKAALLGPYRFFDVEGVQAKGQRGQSLVNVKEIDVALNMYERFSKDYRDCDLRGKIGVITPYKAQLFELRNRFRSRFGENVTEVIEFNTTDAFQGRECEIIIFSCVRASSTGGIGFMTDIRRMNVGLTRAKSSLWILGDSRALVQGEFWRKLIEDAKSRDRYTSGDIVSMFRKPLDRAKHDGKAVAQAVIKEEDVIMSDAPAFSESASRRGSGSDTSSIAGKDDGRRTSLNDTLPSRSGPSPVIYSSAQKPANSESKKRPLDGPDTGQPVTKRAAPDRPKSGLAGKFGQRPNKLAKPLTPSDPSAMSVLGMIPPERPPPMPTSYPAPSLPVAPTGPKPKPRIPSNGSMPSTQPNSNGTNRPVPNGPQKKKKPSLFVPKKR